MAWTFKASTIVSSTTNATVATEPAGTAAGDLVVYVATRPSLTGLQQNAPAGWTTVVNQPGVTAVSPTTLFAWIIRGATAPSYTSSRVGNGRTSLAVLTFTPPTGVVSVDTFSSTASLATTSPTTAGFTTANAAELLVALDSITGSATSVPTGFSGGSGVTWAIGQATAASTDNLAVGYGEQATAAATGTFSSTGATTVGDHYLSVVAFQTIAAGSIPITGVAGTGASGSTSPSNSVAISGASAAGVAGATSAENSVLVSGAPATGQIGSISPSLSIALTGVSATGAVGTVTASTGYSASLTGVAATGVSGNVSPNTSIALSGVSATGAVGTVAKQITRSITGVAGAGAVGTVKATRTRALTGVSASGVAGNVTVNNNVTVALTGVSATGAVGTVTAIAQDAPRNSGFVMNEPILERRKREHREKLVSFQNENRKRKARKIEISAAKLFENGELVKGNAEQEFFRLLAKWEALSPAPVQQQGISFEELFKLQVFLRIQQQIQDENDEDELIIALLLS